MVWVWTGCNKPRCAICLYYLASWNPFPTCSSCFNKAQYTEEYGPWYKQHYLQVAVPEEAKKKNKQRRKNKKTKNNVDLLNRH